MIFELCIRLMRTASTTKTAAVHNNDNFYGFVSPISKGIWWAEANPWSYLVNVTYRSNQALQKKTMESTSHHEHNSNFHLVRQPVHIHQSSTMCNSRASHLQHRRSLHSKEWKVLHIQYLLRKTTMIIGDWPYWYPSKIHTTCLGGFNCSDPRSLAKSGWVV